MLFAVSGARISKENNSLFSMTREKKRLRERERDK
jgi:hypothetical protein